MAKFNKYIFNRVFAVIAIVFAFGVSLINAKEDHIFLFKDGKCIKHMPAYYVDSITFAPTIYLSNKQIYISEDCEYASLLFYCTPNKELSQKDVNWTSSDKSIATVKEGRIYPKGVGQCIISCNYGKQKYDCTVDVIPSEQHEYVDLGLPSGTLWATSNLRTNSKYASILTLKYGEPYGKTPGNIYPDSVITEKGFLKKGFDAASIYWGKDWRVPTYKEFEELLMFTERSGDTIKGPNGNYILLSASNSFLSSVDYWVNDVVIKTSYVNTIGFNLGYHSYPIEKAIDYSFVEQITTKKSMIRPVRDRQIDKVTARVAYDKLEMYDTDAPVNLHFNSSPFYAIPDSDVVWKSTDEKVATVQDGVVTPYAEGECEIIGEVQGLTFSSKVSVKSYKPTAIADGFGYVDLGLPSGKKWATTDLGSTVIEKIGDDYPWGDVQPDSEYDSERRPYKHEALVNCNQDGNNDASIQKKWKCFIEAGVLDTNYVLTSNYDAATMRIGKHWQMPTSEDYIELLNNTKSRATKLRGVEGVVFEAANGNGLFIPMGWHLLSDVCKTTVGRVMGFAAHRAKGDSGFKDPYPALDAYSVCAIRPIYIEDEINVAKVDSVYLKTIVLELKQTDKPASLGFSCSNGDDIPASEASWKSSDTTVATVKDGIVYPATYINPIPVSECTITCQYKTFTLTAKVILTRNKIEPSQPVDMGLKSGIMWSSTDMGSSSPEVHGSKYVWGDVEYDTLSKSPVKWEGKRYGELFNLGVLDSLKNLTPEYDIAKSVLGDNWRLPTSDDAKELFNNCITTEVTINGTPGILFTSKINNNAIFMPINKDKSYKLYWTSSYADKYDYNNAWTFIADDGSFLRLDIKMSHLIAVRPVYMQK